MKKSLLLLPILFVVLAIPADAYAQQIDRSGFDLLSVLRPPTDKELDGLAENLQLRPEQRAQMEKTTQQYRNEIQDLVDKYKDARQDLATMLGQAQPNPAQVEDKLEELQKLHSAVLNKEMQLWNSLSNNLTQQQTEEFWRLFGARRMQAPQE